MVSNTALAMLIMPHNRNICLCDSGNKGHMKILASTSTLRRPAVVRWRAQTSMRSTEDGFVGVANDGTCVIEAGTGILCGAVVVYAEHKPPGTASWHIR